MSNYLVIATVTTALAQIIRRSVQSAIDGSDVVIGRPDPNSTPVHRVHLFLYQTQLNDSIRSNDSSTSVDGGLVTRPRMAIDLNYLLTFYGSENQLESQRMLGAVMRDLYSYPVLTKPIIQNAISSQSFLTNSNLADTMENIIVTLLPISLKEMSKLWSIFFQTPYTLSVIYQASVIMIESGDPIKQSLPVSDEIKIRSDVLIKPFPNIKK
ncbi:MAG: DUF4255 domain-containing protein [Smithella sp.]